MREALNSSRIDGMEVSWECGRELFSGARVPQNLEEGLVYNNYKAFKYIKKNRDKELSPGIILGLHRMLSASPFSEPDAVGRYRLEKEDGCFSEKKIDPVWHLPPAAREMEERISRLCRFSGQSMEAADSLHPIIRSILIHLIFLYDQPLPDANGRAARMFFYWSMLKEGYEMAEILSISSILVTVPRQYERSFLYVVTDENDTTYFIIHQLDVLIKALQSSLACLKNACR